MTRPQALVVTVLLLAAVTAGCGSSASPAGSTPATPAASTAGGATGASPQAGRDVCATLTADEVRAATGLEVTGSGTADFDAAHYCEWQLAPGTNAEGVAFKRLVAVSIYNGAASFDLAAQAGTPLAGVGDRAAVVDDVANVLVGDTHFAVVVVLRQPGDDDPALHAQEQRVSTDLARKVAGRV
jgi:hypothetical protein